MAKAPKIYPRPKHPECGKPSLGISPAALAGREIVSPDPWCLKPDIEFDPCCDPNNPKTIIYKDVLKAMTFIRKQVPETPLIKSKCCDRFEIDLHYKMETLHRTGSFHERGALYALKMLNEEQRNAGVYTASLGNWGMALAYQGQKFNIPVTVVLPICTLTSVVDKCQEYGATVATFGKSLAEAKRQAFVMMRDDNRGGIYLNGYDHPHVIAAAGSIGIEILERLPKTDVIIVPIGGGGLIAGIATIVKHLKPKVEIYGVEPDKCCCFFKALENERPYQTASGQSVATSLAVPTAGYNAFHTARSLIDKMVLLDDDWIVKALSHFVEEHKLITEGAGAASLGALMSVPNVVPELLNKTVVCLVSGGNIDNMTLPRVLERAMAVEGRVIKITLALEADNTSQRLRVFSIIANLGCNILKCYSEHAWLTENEFYVVNTTVICETRDLAHACTLKRVMQKLLPNICQFLEDPFSPIPMCACFPTKYPQF